MKRFTYIILIIGACLTSCKDYLDIVPDKVATLDNAFANRIEAEKYLYTCYSYLPDQANPYNNIGLMSGDELWTFYPQNVTSWEIARGNQNVNDPFMNFWDGSNGGKPFYRAIRDCNIFIENVSNENKVNDLRPDMRRRWLAEVRFLKAYYHFYLFRMYGPIVVSNRAVPVTESTEGLQDKRATVDQVVNYIVGQLDSASADLPDAILNRATELGRITRPAALMLKAKVLVTAASPLFNGNSDFAQFTDKDGVNLFPANYSTEKWEKAVAACQEAVEVAEGSGAALYHFQSFQPLSDTTKLQMSIRNSIAEKWNTELIWGLSGRLVNELQKQVMARIDQNYPLNIWGAKDQFVPTLNISNLFYTDKGVPINEDKTWNYAGRYNLSTATEDERFNLIKGYETANIQHNREPRYYADLAFDGSVWYMQNSPTQTDENTWSVKAKVGQPQSRIGAYNYSVTGLWAKKLVNWKLVMQQNDATIEAYPWPEMRLADLYLLYAEALNEVGRGTEAITYLDKIRTRAGLSGVETAWTTYSTKPTKYTTIAGLREIIQQERGIELMFEGSRFWDVRRWKIADKVLNQTIYGWNIDQETAAAYYRPQLLFSQRFVVPRDYFFPLKQQDLVVNKKLVQNLGW